MKRLFKVAASLVRFNGERVVREIYPGNTMSFLQEQMQYVNGKRTMSQKTLNISNTIGARRNLISLTNIIPDADNQSEPPIHTPVSIKELTHLGNVYSKAHGSYVEWKTYVNLEPPLSWQDKKPNEDTYIIDYYKSLQYTLYETGYPETVDRTCAPRTANTREQAVIVIMTSPIECMSILMEGGRQLPEAFNLVLSPSWVSKTPSTFDPNLQTLLLHKAITFGRGGATYIDEFTPPRRVTYFVNFFTNSVTSGQRDDGVKIERNVDCPMSSSVRLSGLVDDKLWTRCIMAEVDMAFPETLAFVYRPARDLKSNSDKITIVEVDEDTDLEDVRSDIDKFLKSTFMNDIDKIVVKPSGSNVLGSVGVSYHHSRDLTAITEAVTSLLMDIGQGETVLIETFVDNIKPQGNTEVINPRMANASLGFRCRVTVCRDFDNKAITSMINCSIAPKAAPINGDMSVCQTLDSTLLSFNVQDQSHRRELEKNICEQSEAVLEAIIKHEGEVMGTENGDNQQTELIGIDMIVTQRDDKIIPVGIEVNSHDCTINCQIAEYMDSILHCNTPLSPPSPSCKSSIRKTCYCKRFGDTDSILTQNGGCMRPLVRTMITRSQLYLMKNKKVLVIGAGGFSKREIWSDAEGYGIKIILVDSNAKHFAADKVDRFIYYDFDDHARDYYHAHNIANMFRAEEGTCIDGCLTFWEDCGPLAALVSELLGTKGTSYEAALVAKKKSETHRVLQTRRDDIPHWPRTFLYSSITHHIKSSDTLDTVSDKLVYPCVLKLEHGSSAVGVVKVQNRSELQRKYAEITDRLRTEESFPGVGLGHDNTMVTMELLEGSEHDVDIVLYDRQLVGAFISDNGPTRTPQFTETAAMMPTSLPLDKQSQLVTAAYQCATEIGLSNGTFNVEFIMTSTGPKLIEINARMGGFYLREWIKRLYSVDSMLFAIMISCGIKPFVPRLTPSDVIMGIMLIPSLHSHILDDNNTRTTLLDMTRKGDITWNRFEETAAMHCGSSHEEPFGNIAVTGSDVIEARVKLLEVCNKLDITCKEYDVHNFTKLF